MGASRRRRPSAARAWRRTEPPSASRRCCSSPCSVRDLSRRYTGTRPRSRETRRGSQPSSRSAGRRRWRSPFAWCRRGAAAEHGEEPAVRGERRVFGPTRRGGGRGGDGGGSRGGGSLDRGGLVLGARVALGVRLRALLRLARGAGDRPGLRVDAPRGFAIFKRGAEGPEGPEGSERVGRAARVEQQRSLRRGELPDPRVVRRGRGDESRIAAAAIFLSVESPPGVQTGAGPGR